VTSVLFPKPLHEMTTDELATEINRIRSERRKYLTETRKRPQRRAAGLDDQFDKVAKALTASDRDALLRLLKERKEGKE